MSDRASFLVTRAVTPAFFHYMKMSAEQRMSSYPQL